MIYSSEKKTTPKRDIHIFFYYPTIFITVKTDSFLNNTIYKY